MSVFGPDIASNRSGAAMQNPKLMMRKTTGSSEPLASSLAQPVRPAVLQIEVQVGAMHIVSLRTEHGREYIARLLINATQKGLRTKKRVCNGSLGWLCFCLPRVVARNLQTGYLRGVLGSLNSSRRRHSWKTRIAIQEASPASASEFYYRQAVVKSICRNKRLKTCGSR